MLQRLHIALLTLLFFNGGSARGDDAAVSAAPDAIPARTVVLTFDDAVKSHVTVVAPLLKELGFGATFFVTHAWMDDAQHFLSWDDVAAIHKMGFEIGNHTWTHGSFNTPLGAARLADELARVEIELARVGVPKPISFAWTGNAFGPESVAVLEAAGYRLARRGMQPEVPYGRIHPGPLFDPARHHALLIPTAGDGYPDWNLAHFKKVVDRAAAGKIAVLQFHGVPDVVHPWVHTPVDQFRQYMRYLKDNDFHVIALGDVEKYLPTEPVDDDPTLKMRYPDGK
ncbi:MAG: polysaccharide deacetylase family protein [Planctomycetales bacterium]|nr:polysaccharide deacetylase family protein [Planctomycetales bacterium]